MKFNTACLIQAYQYLPIQEAESHSCGENYCRKAISGNFFLEEEIKKTDQNEKKWKYTQREEVANLYKKRWRNIIQINLLFLDLRSVPKLREMSLILSFFFYQFAPSKLIMFTKTLGSGGSEREWKNWSPTTKMSEENERQWKTGNPPRKRKKFYFHFDWIQWF